MRRKTPKEEEIKEYNHQNKRTKKLVKQELPKKQSQENLSLTFSILMIVLKRLWMLWTKKNKKNLIIK